MWLWTSWAEIQHTGSPLKKDGHFTVNLKLKLGLTVLFIWKINENYSRLWGSSNAKAHQCTEDEDPPINRCKRTHEAVEHSPQHAHLKTLCAHTIKTSCLMNDGDWIRLFRRAYSAAFLLFLMSMD